MTESPKRHRVSLSRKLFGGKVFVNESAEFDDPRDPAEVAMVIANIKSAGYSSIVEALEDRIDDDAEAEIARIRGERRGRIGLPPLEEPKRKKTATPDPEPESHDPDGTRLSTIGQRSEIRGIINVEESSGTESPWKRNFLTAIMRRERIDILEELSFAGAAKVLSKIADQEGFQSGTDIAKVDIPRTPRTDEEERELAEADALDHDRARAAVISQHEQEERPRYTNLVEGPDGGELTGEPKEVQLEVAKAEADEMDGVER